ncbi:MAG: hypothetical protein FJZ01_21185 [Candidatus Sericytochromatia bacterium]|nr:hypothetical protein [Candidatus Tanganyikabacteria bacterium]
MPDALWALSPLLAALGFGPAGAPVFTPAADAGRQAGGQAAQIVASTAASLSVDAPRHVQVRVGLGVRPVREVAGSSAANVPIYYSSVGAVLAADVAPPIGVRAGLEFYPAGYNDWYRPAAGQADPSSFDGVSADLDFTVSTHKLVASGFLPFIGLGGRASHMTPVDPKVRNFAAYSLSLLLGVRIAGGFALETRYPLGDVSPHPPAAFETTAGLWWSL